ncbi:hypothetical protein HPC62_05925 [Thermoleptolyngbya sichuanensis A183]|uniref:Uncharacterized protein n=1 Tax=Thermoleptolyngbya sichuanensis A183 TaxID=2737172 RepID=A0A6M8BCH2_9CYAN|nr:hypothetical protein [Thermoleptolyngbya sichuanensis]QKD81796.1 hypothetical protein HPC62_05925 [Thermoleptolyngbya sichuanensis A183]
MSSLHFKMKASNIMEQYHEKALSAIAPRRSSELDIAFKTRRAIAL